MKSYYLKLITAAETMTYLKPFFVTSPSPRLSNLIPPAAPHTPLPLQPPAPGATSRQDSELSAQARRTADNQRASARFDYRQQSGNGAAGSGTAQAGLQTQAPGHAAALLSEQSTAPHWHPAVTKWLDVNVGYAAEWMRTHSALELPEIPGENDIDTVTRYIKFAFEKVKNELGYHDLSNELPESIYRLYAAPTAYQLTGRKDVSPMAFINQWIAVFLQEKFPISKCQSEKSRDEITHISSVITNHKSYSRLMERYIELGKYMLGSYGKLTTDANRSIPNYSSFVNHERDLIDALKRLVGDRYLSEGDDSIFTKGPGRCIIKFERSLHELYVTRLIQPSDLTLKKLKSKWKKEGNFLGFISEHRTKDFTAIKAFLENRGWIKDKGIDLENVARTLEEEKKRQPTAQNQVTSGSAQSVAAFTFAYQDDGLQAIPMIENLPTAFINSLVSEDGYTEGPRAGDLPDPQDERALPHKRRADQTHLPDQKRAK
jgi:hypothetical protein